MLAITNREIESVEPLRFGNRPGSVRHLRVGFRGEEPFPEREESPTQAATRLAARARRLAMPVVVFVHGFNTTLGQALRAAARLEHDFDVIAVPFCWPADGGPLGVARYRADKRDALVSAVALAGLCETIGRFLRGNARRDCPVRVTLLAHSMGCYLVKALTKSSVLGGAELPFDSIVLAAPDVNAEGHAEWLDRLAFRRRLFVLLNEDDAALAASRAKFGHGQQARLGHWTRRLDARHATYVDLTGGDHVGPAHTCFAGEPLRNDQLRAFLREALHGGAAERQLPFDPVRGAHVLRDGVAPPSP